MKELFQPKTKAKPISAINIISQEINTDLDFPDEKTQIEQIAYPKRLNPLNKVMICIKASPTPCTCDSMEKPKPLESKSKRNKIPIV
jgi:hypothetical protein